MTAKPPATSSTNDDETFGALVRRLRKSQKQEDFGARFGKSRQLISNTEHHREASEPFMKLLVGAYPDEALRIEAAYQRFVAGLTPKATRRKRGTGVQGRVERFIETGSFNYARRAILEALDNDTPDGGKRHWLYQHLATALFALDEWAQAVAALHTAISHAETARLVDGEISSRARLATAYRKRAEFQKALSVLDAGLQRHPEADDLWRRQGYVHWYKEDFSAAYASLTTALQLGSPRLTVLFSRGQVLAEWGNNESALADIDAYLKAPNKRAVNIAKLRGVRARVWCQMGRTTDGFAEFAAIEHEREDASWFHYHRGICYAADGQEAKATEYLLRSMNCRNPLVNPPRRTRAIALLKQYNEAVVIPDLPDYLKN